MRTKLFFAALVMLFSSQVALAWPACPGNWNQVVNGTQSTGGLGQVGEIYASGGLTWQCQSKPTVTPPPSTTSTQNQNQTQSQATNNNASATGGNASSANNATAAGNQTTVTSNVEAPKVPVATAYAPPVFPTVTCFKGYSGGVQTMPVGASFGGGKIDKNCAILETARHAPNLLAFCKVYVSNEYVKRAGVTMADCLKENKQ